MSEQIDPKEVSGVPADGPLRDTFDWLRDQAAAALDNVGRILFRDPWGARDAYIAVVLGRSAAAREGGCNWRRGSAGPPSSR